MTQLPNFATKEEINNRILSRFDIFDLREVLDIERGEERLLLSNPMRLISSGEVNLIKFWIIQSEGRIYEVRRFFHFSFCSCSDFFFNHLACKHLSFTYPPTCKCGKEIEIRGKQCSNCEMSQAIYYKPETPSEKIGGFRI